MGALSRQSSTAVKWPDGDFYQGGQISSLGFQGCLSLSCGEGYALCGLRWTGASCLASEGPKELKRYRGSYFYPAGLNTDFLPCLEEPPPASSLNAPSAGARFRDSWASPQGSESSYLRSTPSLGADTKSISNHLIMILPILSMQTMVQKNAPLWCETRPNVW